MQTGTATKKLLLGFTWIFFVIVLLLWPAIVNGNAIFFYDSLSYLGSAATAFRQVFGLETPWAQAAAAPIEPSLATDAPAGPAAQQIASQAVVPENEANTVIMAGRSIYYGIFIFLSDVLGSLWLAITLQSLIVILAVYMTFLVVLPAALQTTFLSLIVLGVFTSLPFYISYLMPDFMTGIVILAVANIAAFGTRMQRWMFPVWGALLLFGLVSHSSHILIAGAMIAGWGLVQVIRRRTLFNLQFLLLVGTVGLAVVAEVAFFKAVESRYGASPVRPPFLMARTISDGPGYTYLVENCGHHNLRICDFKDVLPQPTNEILWSKDPQTGVYGISDAKTRRELSDQQTEFVFSVLRYDPFGQIGASFQGFIRQLFMIRLREFLYNTSLKTSLDNNLPETQKEVNQKTLLYRGKFPLHYVEIITIFVTIFSLGYILYFFINAIFERQLNKNRPLTIFYYRKNDVLVFIAMVAAGLILNAAVTGILSTPHDRYQARVIWLVPFLSIYLLCLSNRYGTPPAGSEPAASMRGTAADGKSHGLMEGTTRATGVGNLPSPALAFRHGSHFRRPERS